MAKITPPDQGTNYVTISPDADGETLLSLDESEVRPLYEQYGALLFRGFPLEVDGFARFAERYCSHSLPNLSGGREVVDDDANIQTVNLGHDSFPLHPEMSREPYKPDTCFFACQTPPEVGGETILCDGVAIAEALPSELLETMKTRRLLYRLAANDDELIYWLGTSDPTDEQLDNPRADCPFNFEREDDRVFRSFTMPFFHKPMFHAGPAFGNFLLFAWLYQKQNFYPTLDTARPVDARLMAQIKQVSDRLTVPVQWQEQDLVMVDNTRFMHGRNPSGPGDRRRILTYFGYIKSPVLTADQFPDAPWRTCSDTGYVLR